ncbi:MAG: YqgE/AlgH family protein [Planctomycetaceae bacterium]|nr:YqgE/AlgH family protein [Planctomycetaceae bacterium]
MSNSLRGQFLLSARKLRDSNFFKTVVLMVEHGDDGAMGLVVNRPSSVTVQRALSGHFEMPETNELVYIGGPVESAALFVVHNSSDLDTTEKPVVPGVYVGGSAAAFESVVRAATTGEGDLRYRIICGCAGWAPNQLEGEIARGDWHLHPADSEAVFTDDPYALWDNLIRQVAEAHRVVREGPKNAEWN